MLPIAFSKYEETSSLMMAHLKTDAVQTTDICDLVRAE